MSQESKKFTITRWLAVLVPAVVVAVAVAATYIGNEFERTQARQSYEALARSCAAGLQKAMDASKAKGFHELPPLSVKPGSKEWDWHMNYFLRYAQLQSDRRELLQSSEVPRQSLLASNDCVAALEGKEVSIEPVATEKASSAPPTTRPLTYEESVAKAWEDADRANAQADKAMEDLLEGYRKKAVSAKTVPSSGSRVDLFEMPDGKIVTCRTSFRNGARATTCTE